MQGLQHVRTYCLVSALVFLSYSTHVLAQANPGNAKSGRQTTAEQQDGQHDFDFEIGTWKTHVRRLVHPLTGSTTWVEYDGTTVVRKVWNGRANLVELEADSPAGHFEGLNLRLYNPQSHQWSLNFANSNSGTLSTPTIGDFRNGRGEFFDQETLNGRAIYVRFVISDITSNSCRFEQAFSDDGGKTWEVNWIATDTRVKDESEETHFHAAVRDAQFHQWPRTSGRQRLRPWHCCPLPFTVEGCFARRASAYGRCSLSPTWHTSCDGAWLVTCPCKLL